MLVYGFSEQSLFATECTTFHVAVDLIRDLDLCVPFTSPYLILLINTPIWGWGTDLAILVTLQLKK